MLSTTFGILVVLTLLYFAAHLLLNLWLISVVDDVATDAAVSVARTPTGEDVTAAQAVAMSRARHSLGQLGGQVEMTFESTADDTVVLHVRAPELRLLPAGVADPLGMDGIDRRVVVRRESAPGAAP